MGSYTILTAQSECQNCTQGKHLLYHHICKRSSIVAHSLEKPHYKFLFQHQITVTVLLLFLYWNAFCKQIF